MNLPVIQSRYMTLVENVRGKTSYVDNFDKVIGGGTIPQRILLDSGIGQASFILDLVSYTKSGSAKAAVYESETHVVSLYA